MRAMILAAALLPMTAAAQEAPGQRTIRVTGVGKVRTPPDVARLQYWVRGEGATPDAASAALAAKQKAILGGIVSLLGAGTEPTTGDVTIIEVRDRGCDDNRGYGGQPRLSQGACAVIGHVATMQASVRTRAIEKAGTAAGLAARLGASDARLTGFELAAPADAQRRATAAAIADAKARAQAVASGAGERLGPLLSVSDQNGFSPAEIVVTGARAMAPPPPPPPPPPVEIDVKPAPIETQQQVFVTYAIAPQ